jgi:hypothetical protein
MATHRCDNADPTCDIHKSSCCVPIPPPIFEGALSEGLKKYQSRLGSRIDLACRLIMDDPMLIYCDATLYPGRTTFNLGGMDVSFSVREEHENHVLVLTIPKTANTSAMTPLELRENALQELGKITARLEQQEKNPP